MANFVAQLQDSLKQNVVLMIMGDEGIIDHLRQIGIRVARNLSLVDIAEHGIQQNGRGRRLHKNAGVAEIAPAGGGPFISLVARRWSC